MNRFISSTPIPTLWNAPISHLKTFFRAKPRAAFSSARGLYTKAEIIHDLPNPYHLLPEPIQRYTVGSEFDPLNPQETLKKGSGGGHHGSHPHLVHEFVRSVIENREPRIGVELAANITGAGICAHTSAMKGGIQVDVPHIRA